MGGELGGELVVSPLEALFVSLGCQDTSVRPYTTIGHVLNEINKNRQGLCNFGLCMSFLIQFTCPGSKEHTCPSPFSPLHEALEGNLLFLMEHLSNWTPDQCYCLKKCFYLIKCWCPSFY